MIPHAPPAGIYHTRPLQILSSSPLPPWSASSPLTCSAVVAARLVQPGSTSRSLLRVASSDLRTVASRRQPAVKTRPCRSPSTVRRYPLTSHPSLSHFGWWVGEEVGRAAVHFDLEPKWYSGFTYVGGRAKGGGEARGGFAATTRGSYVSRLGSSLPSECLRHHRPR